jgi:hypothetical protein
MRAFKFLVDENVGQSVMTISLEKVMMSSLRKKSFRVEKTSSCLIMRMKKIESS